MTRTEKARKLTKDAKESYRLIGREWTKLAGIFAKVIDDKLWDVDFDSFEDWLDAVGDKKASQAYSMAKTYRELEKTVPAEALNQMTMANARDLAEVPASKRTAEMAHQATELPNNQYRKELNKAVPGLNLEQRGYKGFQLEKSCEDMLARALALAKEKFDVETDSAAIEVIASQFISSEGETPHYMAGVLVVDTAEKLIDPNDTAKPPDVIGWGTLLTVIENMARVFGIRKRAMPVGERVAMSEPGQPRIQ